MKTTADINIYPRVGAINSELELTVESYGQHIFHWDKTTGDVTFFAPDGPETSENQIKHMNTALKIAGWNSAEFVIWKNDEGKKVQLVLTGRDGAALGWINLDDKNNLSFKLRQADLDRNETN